MTHSSIHMEELIVDEQLISIPDFAFWSGVLNGAKLQNLPINPSASGALVAGLADFALKHKEQFRLGLYRPGHLAGPWLPLLLFKSGDSWRRVQLEHLTCDACGWTGSSANTTEPSLYFGTPNELGATQAANSLPKLGCPACGKALPRAAVWVEE